MLLRGYGSCGKLYVFLYVWIFLYPLSLAPGSYIILYNVCLMRIVSAEVAQSCNSLFFLSLFFSLHYFLHEHTIDFIFYVLKFTKNIQHLLSIRRWSSLQKSVSSCRRSWKTVGKNSSSFRPNTQESWLRWRPSGQSLLLSLSSKHIFSRFTFILALRASNKNISISFKF